MFTSIYQHSLLGKTEYGDLSITRWKMMMLA